MFYLKTTQGGNPVKIEIYDDEIYTRCYTCGKEIQADAELILSVLENGDFASTNISCCELRVMGGDTK